MGKAYDEITKGIRKRDLDAKMNRLRVERKMSKIAMRQWKLANFVLGRDPLTGSKK